ncbi:MAG: flagellar basal body-associated FliL family protein [Deltaproteobacteria bacterium]|nr:flagellar basal body-associated FliL family protein [Deltaproteobacteria bacterium]
MAEAEKKEKEKEKEEAAHPPKKGKGLLIAIIAAVVLAGAGAAGLILFKGKAPTGGGQEKDAPASKHAGAPEKEGRGGKVEAPEKEGRGGKEEAGSVFKLEPFIVNLQDNSGTRYLKLTLNLELSSPDMQSELTAQNSKVRDSLIILLSSKNYSDIGTVEGKYQLRDEIVARVNQFVTRGKVKTAYFTEFVIQ